MARNADATPKETLRKECNRGAVEGLPSAYLTAWETHAQMCEESPVRSSHVPKEELLARLEEVLPSDVWQDSVLKGMVERNIFGLERFEGREQIYRQATVSHWRIED